MLLNDILPDLQTGDIFLFHGTSPVSFIIDIVTGSKYSHVAMVDRTPGSSGPDGLMVWQSFEPQGGVVYEPLIPFLQQYPKDEAGAYFICRQLSVTRTPAMLTALAAFQSKVKGLPFPSYSEWILNYIAGRLGIDKPETSFYCSELVAQSYMAMGLLGPQPLATVYSPEFFAANYTELKLLMGASFGPEIPVPPPS